MNNAKKQRQTIEWERLEIFSRKLENQGNISYKYEHNKGQKWYGPNKSRRDLDEVKEYTEEELYKNGLNDTDKQNGVVTHLKPDILECKVKWALGSITMNKTSGGDGIPVELFQILNDEACKSAALIRPENLESSAVTGLEKGQFSFQSQRKAMPKNIQATAQLHSFHMLVK